MNNEEIFGIVAALLFFSLCVICCADWYGECSSEIDFINNQINEDTIEDTDIESNTTEKKVPKQNLTLMHQDQINPIL
mgnify:FL=1